MVHLFWLLYLHIFNLVYKLVHFPLFVLWLLDLRPLVLTLWELDAFVVKKLLDHCVLKLTYLLVSVVLLFDQVTHFRWLGAITILG